MSKLNWKSIVGWGIAALVAGFIVYTNMQERKNKEDVFYIKALVPLTGQAASVADSVREGVELAKEEIASRYGNKFKVILLDSGSEPSTAISIYRQQIEGAGDNQALLYTLSPVGKAITPLLDGKTLTFALAAVEGLSNPEKNIFQLSPKSVDVKPALIKFIKEHNIKTVSVAYPGNDYGLENLNIVRSAVSENNGNVVQEIPYSNTDFDFRIQALKLAKQNPDMIFVIGVGNTYLNVLRDINAQEYKGILMSDWSFAIPHFYTAYPELTERVYMISPIPPKFFEDAYDLKYHKPAWMLEAGVFYDSIVLTAEACMKTDCSANAMGKYVASIKNYDGAVGKYSFNPSGDITVEAKVSKIKDGKIVPVEE
ncbi:MAG: ABC transporter substrate-binding protein [Alphaproteobacteria bacterium]|nr:ABC transporter substrate-binding protein [Alphaproteobacteria bacterium]